MTPAASSLVRRMLCLLPGIFALLIASIACADSLSVTVTPPLTQLTIGPGDSWTGALKIVNNNDRAITYYAQLVDMQASDEEGHSKFIPLVNEPQDPATQAFSLARWITVSSAPIDVPAGASEELPYTVKVPDNAEPGGHYAAILVGTQPPATPGGNMMRVASYVSSLIFVTIKGDVIESGRIREFSTAKSVYQSPAADFTLRFENTGNTHVKPQGDVTIYNMWGKERGKVLFNQDSDFGNVLPKSVRKFQFSWQGEDNLFDIGLYSAVVTMNYGQDGKKNVSATTYFWIVPIIPVSIALGSIILFMLLITFFIRRYIKRALALEQARLGIVPQTAQTPAPPRQPLASSIPAPAPLPVRASTPAIATFIEPIREGVIDLRKIRQGSAPTSTSAPQSADTKSVAPQKTQESSYTIGEFINKYKLFFLFIAVVIIAVSVLSLYLGKALQPKRSFQITDVKVQVEPAP